MDNDQFRDMLIGGEAVALLSSLGPDEAWTVHCDGIQYTGDGGPYHVEAFRFGVLLFVVDSDGDLQAVKHHSVDCAQGWVANAMTQVRDHCAFLRAVSGSTSIEPVFTHTVSDSTVDLAMASVTIPDDLSTI